MADHKQISEPDQNREVQHFSGRYGLHAEQVRDLLVRYGSNRNDLARAARGLKKP